MNFGPGEALYCCTMLWRLIGKTWSPIRIMHSSSPGKVVPELGVLTGRPAGRASPGEFGRSGIWLVVPRVNQATFIRKVYLALPYLFDWLVSILMSVISRQRRVESSFAFLHTFRLHKCHPKQCPNRHHTAGHLSRKPQPTPSPFSSTMNTKFST